jgi:hypothetical protein
VAEEAAGPGKHEHKVNIQIDRVHYTVTQEVMTGAEIRKVPPDPIPETRDLYEVRPGEEDLLIGDTDTVQMRNGLRFFTAPAQINPGQSAEGRRRV